MEKKFLDAMMFRHACKAFDATRKISEKDFNDILEMGRLSPSSFGFEPWKFVIIQNSALREKMKAFTWGAQGQLPTASHFMVILARKAPGVKYDSSYIQHMLHDVKQMPEEVVGMINQFYEKFQKEDFKLLESDRTLFDWASKQTYLALANMMTGAATKGIDSCPIEGFDVAKTEEFLKNELGIDTDAFGASVMVAFGYRKSEPREKSRQDIKDITAWYR
ncbi:NAD(P)H-dependent oxidoreductase [Sulfurospirillum sp. 1612]|uniref:NAD(P)H-dependent oxidoreductase n=1 Tax=Sulfurospirillum sp. 1612 TaxID=3094835 RepID=UPI002F91F4FE